MLRPSVGNMNAAATALNLIIAVSQGQAYTAALRGAWGGCSGRLLLEMLAETLITLACQSGVGQDHSTQHLPDSRGALRKVHPPAHAPALRSAHLHDQEARRNH